MTRDDIIRMAKEADLWLTSDERIAAVVRFAALVAAAERFACAQVCEPPTQHNDPLTAWQIALAIRARGEK
jgi:hypothetical protein